MSERGPEVTALAMHEAGVTITYQKADGSAESVDAGWVVGCDGPQSLVRQAGNIGWEGKPLKGLMVPLADVKAKGPLPQVPGQAYVGLTDKGYFLTLPLPPLPARYPNRLIRVSLPIAR